MAEVLGIVAAATQLGAYCFSVCEVYGKFKDLPSALEKQRQALEEIHLIARTILENPSLQTLEVVRHVDSMTARVQALDSLLRQGLPVPMLRLFQLRSLLAKDKKVNSIFVSLESSKITLLLYIANSQTWALHQFQSKIVPLQKERHNPTSESNTPDTQHDDRQVGGSEASPLVVKKLPLDLMADNPQSTFRRNHQGLTNIPLCPNSEALVRFARTHDLTNVAIQPEPPVAQLAAMSNTNDCTMDDYISASGQVAENGASHVCGRRIEHDGSLPLDVNQRQVTVRTSANEVRTGANMVHGHSYEGDVALRSPTPNIHVTSKNDKSSGKGTVFVVGINSSYKKST